MNIHEKTTSYNEVTNIREHIHHIESDEYLREARQKIGISSEYHQIANPIIR